MGICNYLDCVKEATVKGFVLARDPEGGQDVPTDVVVCDKHKKTAGFFEYKRRGE